VAVQSGSTWVPVAAYSYNDGGGLVNEALNVLSLSGSRHYTSNGAGQPVGYSQLIGTGFDVSTSTFSYDSYSSTMAYRPDQRLGEETVTKGGTTTLTAAGVWTVTDPGTTEATRRYNYDNAGQLCTVSTGPSPVGCDTTAGTVEAYRYGSRGNRLSKTIDGDTTVYVTNSAGQLVSAQAGTATTTYGYDPAGRRDTETTVDGAVTTRSVSRSFDAAGNPSVIDIDDTTAGNSTETRAYRADGLIGISTDGSYVIDWAWDTTRAVPAVVDSRINDLVWFRAALGLETLDFEFGGTTAWYKNDIRGSAIASYTSPGTLNPNALAAPDGYDSFGNPTNVDHGYGTYRGAVNNHGIINFQHRDYDPQTGTFTTVDPLDGVDGTPTVANPYHYTDNDPLNKTDPIGLRAGDPELNGIELTSEQKREGRKEADQIVRDAGTDEVNLRGSCVSGQATVGALLGTSFGGSGCIIVDAYEYSLLGSLEFPGLASPVPVFNLSAGAAFGVAAAAIFSNAYSVDQISGYSACFGSSLGGELFGGSVEVCLGLTTVYPIQFSGYWTIMGGLGLVSGFEFHGTIAKTGYVRLHDRISQWLPFVGDIDPVCVALWGPTGLGGCPKDLS
jgi:RHS repeat-associated protein